MKNNIAVLKDLYGKTVLSDMVATKHILTLN